MRHNADTTKTWKRTINRFTDQTEEERAYVRGGGLYHGPRHPLRQDHTPLVHPAEGLPESVDWRTSKNIPPTRPTFMQHTQPFAYIIKMY